MLNKKRKEREMEKRLNISYTRYMEGYKYKMAASMISKQKLYEELMGRKTSGELGNHRQERLRSLSSGFCLVRNSFISPFLQLNTFTYVLFLIKSTT